MDLFHITAESLSKRFNREWIFRNLNFSFRQGNVYAITGPNGSGKSTLLQILWGQMPATSGSVSYGHGGAVMEADAVYKQVSIAAPYMDLIDEFTLEEQVRFHFRMRKPIAGHTPSTIIEAMHLEHARNKLISNFSSGMKQRLKLGLAFFTQARALFLDEPGTNLDQHAIAWYHKTLKDYGLKKLTLIATNQPDEYPENAVKLDLLEFK